MISFRRRKLVRSFAPPMALSFLLVAAGVTVAGAQSTRGVVFVANAVSGTVDVIDGTSFRILRTIDVIPDGPSPSPTTDPVQAGAQPVVEGAAGENFAQDFDISPDGATLYVSRGHRADVAAFDIASGDMLWRVPVSGFRADHMTISDNGQYLFVSALTESQVEVIDVTRAEVVNSFPTGDWSHDNVISPDGTRVYNGSIGNILTPPETRNDRPEELDAVLNEPYQLTIASTDPPFEVLDRHEFPRGIRPFVLTDDGTTMYAQLSFFHGIVEYDLENRRMVRTVQLPIDEGVTEDDYSFEAPHHGLELSPDGSLLCAGGRASDYVALVSTATMLPVAIVEVGDAPSEAHNGPFGDNCWVSNSRSDDVSVISYTTHEEIERIAVSGDEAKHLEAAHIPESVLFPPE